ncbi:hypothetical protein Leryth_021486 [Lithospermum erythrorhizon]|nr:hypothetical protein Leryth_021486 [Lithospermum erythrorhizon]
MKNDNFRRFWGKLNKTLGRRFSFTLAFLILVTIFLWSWEDKPLAKSLTSPEKQFVRHTSEILIDDSAASSVLMEPREHRSVENSDSEEAKDTIEEHGIDDADNVIGNLTAIPTNRGEACNYARGTWVTDNRQILYSGSGCKQWLSEMWACRLTQRTDFSYEGYRWQPENCDMPEFEGSEFLEKMRGKILSFVGDSLGRQQFQSLMCMITGGLDNPEVEDVGYNYGLGIPPGAVRPNGWAYLFPITNTTILYYWSASLCGIEPINATDPDTEYAMHLDRPPGFLQTFIDQFNVVVLNTGHHWNRGKVNANRWVMYVNGKPLHDRKLAQIGNAKNLTVHSIARWLDSQIPLHPDLKVFFRTISPRHFFHGEWNSGGSCDNTIPLTRGSEVRQHESSDPVIAEAVKGTKVSLLDITALSELRDEGHISHYSIKASEGINDCLHWCLPGIPDTWNEILCAQL